MKSRTTPDWALCFAGGGDSEVRPFRTIRRSGHAFFYLTDTRHEALALLNTYQPQSRMAKSACRLLRYTGRLGGLQFLSREMVEVNNDSPFSEFLRKASGMVEMPQFGVLQGNPNTPGTRVIFITLDSTGAPDLAIKAGWTHEARTLVQREIGLLNRLPANMDDIPRCLGVLENDHVMAFAMGHAGGTSPKIHDMPGVAATLSRWIRDKPPIALGNVPAWQRMMDGDDSRLHNEFQKLSGLQIVPVVFHGDFAPWNIRVSASGKWQTLDWERGEETGVPGWDWFHYVVQTSILVQRESPHKIVDRLHALLASPEFVNYARRTRIASYEHQLLRGYFSYALSQNQTEGYPELKAAADQYSAN